MLTPLRYDPYSGLRESAHTDDPSRFESIDHSAQMPITYIEERAAILNPQLVRGDIAAALLQEQQWTVVGNKVLLKECLRFSKALPHKPPESSPAHLAARAIVSPYRPRGMLSFGFPHRASDPHPIPNRLHFAEGHAGLGHTPGTGIHTDKDRGLPLSAKSGEIDFVRLPGILQRIVDVSDRGEKCKLVCLASQIPRCLDQYNREVFGHRMLPIGGLPLGDEINEGFPIPFPIASDYVEEVTRHLDGKENT